MLLCGTVFIMQCLQHCSPTAVFLHVCLSAYGCCKGSENHRMALKVIQFKPLPWAGCPSTQAAEGPSTAWGISRDGAGLILRRLSQPHLCTDKAIARPPMAPGGVDISGCSALSEHLPAGRFTVLQGCFWVRNVSAGWMRSFLKSSPFVIILAC